MELLHPCIANLVKELSRDSRYGLIDNLKEYEEPNNRKRVVYHDQYTSNNDKLQRIIDDAIALLPKCKEEYECLDEYQLLFRVLGNQSKDDGDGKKFIVTDYNYDVNTKRDTSFIKEYLKNADTTDEIVVLITDGA